MIKNKRSFIFLMFLFFTANQLYAMESIKIVWDDTAQWVKYSVAAVFGVGFIWNWYARGVMINQHTQEIAELRKTLDQEQYTSPLINEMDTLKQVDFLAKIKKMINKKIKKLEESSGEDTIILQNCDKDLTYLWEYIFGTQEIRKLRLAQEQEIFQVRPRRPDLDNKSLSDIIEFCTTKIPKFAQLSDGGSNEAIDREFEKLGSTPRGDDEIFDYSSMLE